MRTRIGWVLMLAAVGCQSKSSTPTAQAPSSLPDPPAVVQALKLLENGKVAEGLEVLNAAIEQSPQEGRLYGARASLHHRAGLNAQALADLSKALEFTPDDAQLWNNKGFIQLSLQRLDDAVQSLDRALELKPSMASACNNRGLVSLAQGKFRDAISWFDRALAEDAEYVDALNNRGFAWMQLGRMENAYADLNQALRISPEYVNALHNRGLLKARAGELEESVLDFTEAMMLDPRNPRYFQHRGEVYNRLGRTEEGAADFRMLDWLLKLQNLNRAIAAEPRNVTAWTNRARHHWDRGNEKEAHADLEKALEINPSYGGALVLKGRIAVTEKRYEEALKICEVALESDDGAAAASVRGDAFLALGQYDDALESFAAAKRFDSSVAEAYFRKSQELTSRGETDAAQEQLDLALELDPTVETRLR